MPVGTQGTVKALEHRTIKEAGANLILGNTYHLYLRPGLDVLSHFRGLHKFINWNGVILTDSGGYQVYSLQDIRKLTEDGVEFKSHIDGSKHFFSPEKVVDIQKVIGSDIMMVLDECAPYPASEKYVADSASLSLKWALRSRDHFLNSHPLWGHAQYQFAIMQGGMYKQIRKSYIEACVEKGFDGYSIGGLSVGEPAELMYEITDLSCQLLPEDHARYLMGVGTPENILNCIELGIDMFDCVLPTRNARNGQLFTSYGKINIRNQKYKFEEKAIDEEINSYASRNFSLAYLRHLIISQEILGLMLATQHNIAFYMNLVKTAREKILSGEFSYWKKEFLEKYNS
jgi:queuine tRNA-ribosyltransferase